MTLYPPSYQQESTYPAQLDRMAVADMAVGGPYPTIFATASYAVTQRAAGANMSVDVAPGRALVPGTDTGNQGSYWCWSDAVVNVAINTAPGTGQSRIDSVILQVRDDFVTGLGNNDFQVIAVQGVAAATGTQVPPALPASSLLLANITIGPNAVSIIGAAISDQRPGRATGPRGWQGESRGPASQADYTALATAISLTIPVYAGRRYRINALCASSSQITATGTSSFRMYDADSNNFVFLYNGALAVGQNLIGGGSVTYAPTVTKSGLFTISALASAGALRVPANNLFLSVDDIGAV